MKRCPVCNRTYTDELMMFCADDGTQLVSGPSAAEPFTTPPSSQPTIAFTPSPAASNYQPTSKKRIWLALIALVFGLFALPFLLYSLSQPILWEYGFRNAPVVRLFASLWGVATVLGTGLMVLSVLAGLVAIIMSMKKPAQYGGRVLAFAGPALSVLLMVLVVGAFAFRRWQGPRSYESDVSTSNSNSSSNHNWNRSSNDNSASDSNSNPESSDSSSDSTYMSETDKYRLFFAAAKSGDLDLQQRAARKIGIVDSSGMPTSNYESFIKGTVNWAVTDRAWVQDMDTPAKGRAYAEARL